MSDRVTWLLAVKDGLPYLSNTLASIAGQTYKDQEILAWDNGSTDGTIDVLNEWIPSRIPGKVISDDPQPIQISRARLVELAATELCAIIDADDLADPTRLEKQVDFLRQNPDIAVVGTQMREIDSNGAVREPRPPYPTDHDDIVNMMIIDNPIGQPAVLFRRSALLQTGNYRQVEAEDYDIWMRMAGHYKLANLDEILTSYRIHERSRTLMLQRQNRLLVAVDEMIADIAPALYGIPTSTALKFRQRKLFYAMPHIREMANHLDKTQNRKPGQTLQQASFLDSNRALVGRWDRLTGIQLAHADPRPDAYRRDFREAVYAFSPRLGLLRHVMPIIRRLADSQEKSAIRRWAEKQATKLPADIDCSITVTGRKDYADYIKMGQFGRIEKGVSIWISTDKGAEPVLTLGTRTFIGQHTVIGTFQPISIGSNTMIGAYSYVISANHRYERRDIPIGEQGFSGAPIVIEDDVWLGTHVVVLPGVTIGKGAIVAAGSIVNKSIPAYQIWGGAPARFIKERP